MKSYEKISGFKCRYCKRAASMHTKIRGSDKIENLCMVHAKFKMMSNRERDSREFPVPKKKNEGV